MTAVNQPSALKAIADPQPGPGQVLIRPHATGVCGTDIHVWRGESQRRTDYLEQELGKKSTDQEEKIMNDQLENGMRGSMSSAMPIEHSWHAMRSLRVTRALFVGALCLFMLFAICPTFASDNDDQVGKVLPPNAKFQGRTYGEWSARWWEWALSIPTADNPILDTTGEDCALKQKGSVWFLAGTFGGPGVIRECTLPPGKAIFFPILNNVAIDTDPTDTVASLRAQAAGPPISTVSELNATVDGIPLKGLFQFHFLSPVFSFQLPKDGLLPLGICLPLDQDNPGFCETAVSDGYWLLLQPLNAGQHTIFFQALTSDGFTVEVTYHLTVRRGE
jgi:Alcohol dehydrogenase GroES-like domain